MSKKQENVHIPKYIKDQPWFYKVSKDTDDGDYLAHHRRQKDQDSGLDIDNNAEPKVGRGIDDEYVSLGIPSEEVGRGRDVRAPKCTNCGALDHVARDCLEPPRKRQIRTVRSHQSFSRRRDDGESWDAKKDRWFGYDGKEYDEVVQGWVKKAQEQVLNADVEDEEFIDTDEEIELATLGLYKSSVTGALANDDANGSKLRASVRLREDKAAYLNDIGSDTINYDPKSRLYKTEELGEIDAETKMFHRHLKGESLELTKLNRLVREETLKSGIRDEVENEAKTQHVLVANPTKYELLMKEKGTEVSQQAKQDPYAGKSAKRAVGTRQSQEKKRSLLERYG